MKEATAFNAFQFTGKNKDKKEYNEVYIMQDVEQILLNMI